MSEAGIANVWLCEACGRFEFTKPEYDPTDVIRFCTCLHRHGTEDGIAKMKLLPDQAVISVRVRS